MVGSGLLYAQETVTLPEDISSFEHVSSMVVLDEKSPLFGIHHSYLNPRWMEAFQQLGPYPAGTVFIGKLYKIEKDERLKEFLFEGDLRGLSFMRKDENAKATGGWVYALFGPDRKRIEIDVRKACFDCHSKAKDTDFIFSKPLN